MKRTTLLMAALAACLVASAAPARDHGDGGGGGERGGGQAQRDGDGGTIGNSGNGGAGNGSSAQSQAAPAPRQPLVINMGHSSSGGHNRNYPTQRTYQAQPGSRPSWGQVQRFAAPSAVQGQVPGYGQHRSSSGVAAIVEGQSKGLQPASGTLTNTAPRAGVNAWVPAGNRAAVAAHHHPYSPGYVRGRLRKIGVTSEPNYITDRAEIVHTDRAHSLIPVPSRGPEGRPIGAAQVRPGGADAAALRAHMGLVSGQDWQDRLGHDRISENRSGRYYWHQDNGFSYCHYLDGSGYHWYGWYLGDRYFWTRNFSGRWWWYDADFDRWTFFNDGFWWWQDPYHVGDLYCYNDGAYVPVNSADDQVVVSQPAAVDQQTYNSPDNTRSVRVAEGSQDAFLYDTANPPSFDPVYLASGVQRVEFSDPASGRPMEVVLKLNDGSFDLFDAYGRPYNPGAAGAEDDAAQPQAPSGD